MRGAVTAEARAAFTTSFDSMLPVGAENDGTTWGFLRGAEHPKRLKLIQLLRFSVMPGGPGGEGLEGAPSEVGKRTFLRCDGLRLESM